MARKAVNLSEKDIKSLERLKAKFDSISLNDTIRRSIAQASVLSKYVKEDGTLVIETEDGSKISLQVQPSDD